MVLHPHYYAEYRKITSKTWVYGHRLGAAPVWEGAQKSQYTQGK
jgi:hypothetical protein